MPDYDSMLTLKQAARALKISVERIRVMIRHGEIRRYHKFPENMISPDDINAYAGRTVVTVTEG